MVNRETNFNRKKVNRLKSIRDKKRARINNKKKSIGYNEHDPLPLTKKQQRKQKRLTRIMTDLDTTNHSIGKRAIKRRNNKKKSKPENNMQIDS